MAGSVNKVILVGNVGKDPEIRSTQDGKEIANLTLATSDSWKDNTTGERKERTEWHRVVVFSQGLVNVIKNYVKKGSKLYIEGALQTRKWTDNTGAERYTTEIVLQNYNSTLAMLDRQGSGGENFGSAPGGDFNDQYGGSQDRGSRPSKPSPATYEELDDEIPF